MKFKDIRNHVLIKKIKRKFKISKGINYHFLIK